MHLRAVCLPSSRAVPAAAGSFLALMLATACSSAAFATEGYLQNGYGARQKALAGAGVASSTDATAASLNPAGLVNVDSQITGSVSFMHLNGGFNSSGIGGVTADGSHDSAAEWVVIPNFAASWRVNWGLADVFAITAYANGGVNTHYKDIANPLCPPGMSGVFCGGALGLALEQTFISAAFAKQLLPGLSVGLAPILARQTVEVEGVILYSPYSIDPAHFTNQGTSESWGVGVRGGVEWKAQPWLRFGVAGNTPMAMSNFDKYRGLFAGQGAADIPGTIQAGVAVDLKPNLTVMLDYKHIWFGNNPAVANPSTNLPTLGAPFGADNGSGYGLQDVDTVKLGIEWRRSPELTLRAGYSYNTAPLTSRDADLNIMTLGVVQHHITGGLQYKLTKAIDLEMSVMYAPHASITGPELSNPARSVEIGMSELEFTVGAIYRFGANSAPLK